MCKVMEDLRNESIELGRAMGLEAGLEAGRESTLFELVYKSLLPLEIAAAELNTTPDEFELRAREAGYSLN